MLATVVVYFCHEETMTDDGRQRTVLIDYCPWDSLRRLLTIGVEIAAACFVDLAMTTLQITSHKSGPRVALPANWSAPYGLVTRRRIAANTSSVAKISHAEDGRVPTLLCSSSLSGANGCGSATLR